MSLEEIDSLFIKPGEYDTDSAEEGEFRAPTAKQEVAHVEKA